MQHILHQIRTTLLRAPRSIALAAACAGSVFVAGLSGCSTAVDDPVVPVSASEYPAAFDAARDVLRDMNFELQRLDARAGIITTDPKPTTGLITPWDRKQQTAAQEFEDALQHQQRIVRITFAPQSSQDSIVNRASSPAIDSTTSSLGAPTTDIIDLIDFPADTALTVQVYIERIHRPHWRVDSTSIRTRTYAYDPELAQRGMQPQYEVAIAQDGALAARLASLIRARLANTAR